MIGLFARAAEPGARHSSEADGDVAETRDARGYEDLIDETALDGFDPSRGSDNRGLLMPHPPDDRLNAPALAPRLETVGAMASLADRMSKAKSPSAKGQAGIPPRSSTSTLPRRRPPRASHGRSSGWTEPGGSPSRNPLQHLTENSPDRPCRTRLRPCPDADPHHDRQWHSGLRAPSQPEHHRSLTTRSHTGRPNRTSRGTARIRTLRTAFLGGDQIERMNR